MIRENEEKSQRLEVAYQHQRQILVLLQNISLAVSQAETTEAALSQVLAYVCRFMDWPLAHAYLWSEAVAALVSSHIWYTAEEFSFQPFRELTENSRFVAGESAPGTVLLHNAPLTITDVTQHPGFIRQEALNGTGILTYFAFPVVANHQVTAVLEFFSPHSTNADTDITDIISHISTQLGLAIRRQRALRRLQESQAQLAEAQHIAHLGHWEWDVVRDEITWSSELYRIFGLPEDEFAATYQAFLARVHPDDLDYVRHKIEEAYQHGRAYDYFHRIIRPDGSERVLHGRGQAVLDETGQVIKLQGTAQDMTEQKQAELQLAQTVRQLNTLTEVGQAIAASLELPVVYDQVLSRLRPLLGAEGTILFLQEGNELVIVAHNWEDVPDMQGQRIPLNSGIAGHVWQTGQSMLLQGEQCQRRLSPKLMQAAGYVPGAMLAVPIRWQKQQIGILEALHRQADAFEENDLRLLETVATWTAIAIGNARQYEQLQRRLRESDAMAAISRALAQTLKLDEVLHLIVAAAQSIVPSADWAAIHLLQGRPERLLLAASAGLPVTAGEFSLNPGEGIVGHVIANGGVINVPDVQNDSRRLPIDQSMNARSLLVAPVQNRLRRIGTIGVQSATPSEFTLDDEKLLTILGVQAGLAIENARLYTEQQFARQRAEKQRERMRHMARRVVTAQEDERARLARELHDEAGQSLTALKISLELIRATLPEELTAARQNLGDVLELADKTMGNLRWLSHNLRPPGLDMFGLEAALAGLCQEFATHTPLQVSYDGATLPELPPLTMLSLYRFAQEALTNVAKHAAATEVKVVLMQDSAMIRLMVEDNGRGFTPLNLDESLPANGVGLAGMMERLEMINGRLEIATFSGKGSRLTAVVPLPEGLLPEGVQTEGLQTEEE